MHVLILGGTSEAGILARDLAGSGSVAVTTSLAGRTREPIAPAGALRIGGFGGTEGLATYLRDALVDVVVDATHPFAARISANAVAACAAAGVPRLALVRPPWQPQPGDDWRVVADMATAAARSAALGGRQLLAVGRNELAAFAGNTQVGYVVRTVDPLPEPPPVLLAATETARGPFALGDELALLRRHAVSAVVAKASGGDGGYAKIAAARRLGVPVVMVDRPAPPPEPRVATVSAALSWLRGLEAAI